MVKRLGGHPMKSNEARKGEVYKGEIYLVELTGEGSVQRGLRPAIVIQNNTGNRYSPTLQIAPLSGRTNKRDIPTHVKISYKWLDKESVVLVEQARVVNKFELQKKLGSISESDIIKLDEAIKISYGIVPLHHTQVVS